MPTLAAGTSNKPLQRRCAARSDSGFTLLELMVVIVIIGVVISMAVISVKVLGGDHQMDQEAKRLQAILVQSREDAMLTGSDVGLRIDPRGYDFLRFSNRENRWIAVSNDGLLRERTLPEGLNANLRMEGRDVKLKMRNADGAAQAALPQIILQASGDIVPFEVQLSRDGTEELRRISGQADGRIEVHDDTPRKR